MKLKLLLLLFIVVCSSQLELIFAVTNSPITPLPLQTTYGYGDLDITTPLKVYSNYDNDKINVLIAKLSNAEIVEKSISRKMAKQHFCNLIINKLLEKELGAEGYKLSVTESGVEITAASYAGLLYGSSSLIQLVEFGDRKVECQIIKDIPRFEYRGFMLDVSRNFRDKEFVKKQLDMMSYLKLNKFHWHLTDGAGWRIQIDSYPRLTSIAAWRPYETFNDWLTGGKQYCSQNDPRARGGFYTKDDIDEVVKYAENLNITVIPEIEMPGHSEEVLAVYPELSCSGEPYVDGDFCVANPKTYQFLTDVLSEVMDLFPSQYIHVGGDEASKNGWAKCPKCNALMKSENLENYDQLQSHLMHRIEGFLNKNDRSLLGWDEIIDGGLSPNASVMSWRSEQAGIKAASLGHKVVMTPTTYCYFDYYQDAPPFEPEAMGALVTLKKVYSYDPAPDNIDGEEMIIGIQGNLWSEYIETEKHVEYMIYPRLFAISEIGWSAQKSRDYEDFEKRAVKLCAILPKMGYNCFDLANQKGDRDKHINGLTHLAKGKKVRYINKYHEKYASAGELALTDGVAGNWTYNDGSWQGFSDVDLDVVIDLGEKKDIESIKGEFLQNYSAYIWMPMSVEIYASDNDTDYRLLTKVETKTEKEKTVVCFETYKWEGECSARYIRFKAKDHKREHGWLFLDEIIIN